MDESHQVQVPYSGFGIAARGLAMHAFVRVVRTFAFLAVVMPNPRSPRCFASRFKPVPEGWWEYLKAGAFAVRGSGGCNDLILRCAVLPHLMPKLEHNTWLTTRCICSTCLASVSA